MSFPSLRLVHHVANASIARRAEIGTKIRDSIEAQVKVVVAEWGESEDTKGFVANLRSVVQENDMLCRDAKIKLDNS